jgi:hypothetical protein
MEASFGRSFDSVRVHTDAAGAELAESVGAEAVTISFRSWFPIPAVRASHAQTRVRSAVPVWADVPAGLRVRRTATASASVAAK